MDKSIKAINVDMEQAGYTTAAESEAVMTRISVSCTEWRSTQVGDPIQLDAVVIGSGYGGSVAALRLAQKGYKVTVLERGSEFLPGDFPNDFSQLPKYIRGPSADGQSVSGRANGLFEWRVGPGVVSMVGNGLGGGSLINAGVAMRPDADVFAQAAWPAAIRMPAGKGQAKDGRNKKQVPTLEELFLPAEKALQATSWAEQQGQTTKTKMFADMVEKIRFKDTRMPNVKAQPVQVTIDIKRCNDFKQCGDCATGCNYGAKRTLRESYLEPAGKLGVTLVTGASVWTIAPVRKVGSISDDEKVVKWRLRVLDTASISRWPRWADAVEKEGFDIEARFIVLAAGTFGSTELLQRSKDRHGDRWWISPALGSRFSGNGDNLGFMVEKEEVNAIGMGAATSASAKVGPTITAHADLRPSLKKPNIPLRQRLTIEDGSVPGAVERVFTEIVSTALTLSRLNGWPSWSTAVAKKSADASDPLAAGAKLARRSQILLVMGHDESAGRIVFAPGRDASVPYWEEPEKIETYRVQEEVLDDVARRRNAEWVPNPVWRLLPETVTKVMSGPPPPRSITTVHPLGGCVMGDDPRLSVVDHLGRLWRSDRYRESKPTEDWARHSNFLVLDGSIVPTSLGANPLLTITALAERAMTAVPRRRQRPDSANAHNSSPATAGVATSAPPRPSPRPWRRSKQIKWPITMRERLVCKNLPLHGRLARAFGARSAGGELAFYLEVRDWLQMWELAHHPICQVVGSLRVQGGTAEKPMVATYRVRETIRCELLAVHDYGEKWPDRLRWMSGIDPLVRTGITYLITRPDIWREIRNPPAGKRQTYLELLQNKILPSIKQLGHCAERRAMHYHLVLELDRGAEDTDDLDALWTHRWRTNLPHANDLPETIELIGTKRVEYPAQWAELQHWLTAKRRQKHGHATTEDLPPPRLRESFFDQASHLSVTAKEAAGPLLEGRFMMDFAALLTDPPLLLGDTGDLTGGMGALAAYPGLFTRFLLKTRIPDFRLPDYSQAPVADMAASPQLALRPAPPADAPPPRRYVFHVPRGRSLNDNPDVNPNTKFELILWRYARPESEQKLPELTKGTWYEHTVTRAKSILLVHAFAQSGYTFTLDTLPVNLAGALYQAGFEVWILEHRLSTRLPIHEEPSTLDQISWFDLPLAVERIGKQLQSDFRREGRPAPKNLQIHAFAQCLGSASLAMALLSGRLHYKDVTADLPDGFPSPLCPMLASMMLSQTHPLCVGQPDTQARTWIPTMLSNALGKTTIALGVRGPVDAMAETLLDRVFAGLPLPEEEQCPPSHAPGEEDDCATCRRIRFIEAPLFKHRNLTIETHRQLPLHFGKANLRTFAQSAKCVEAERLVDEDGQSIYVTEENVRKYAALPVAFLHGEENEAFHWESARRSATLFAQLYPEQAQRAAAALDPKRGEESNLPVWLVPGHGHYDVLIGKETPQLVYPGIVNFFSSLQAATQPGATDSSSVELHATARFPRVGPLISPLQIVGEDIKFRVSFMIDDRFSDGKRRSHDLAGTRTWAFVRVTAGSYSRIHRLRISSRPASARNLADKRPYRRLLYRAIAYRFALGSVRINAADWPRDTDLKIEAFSVHENMTAEPLQYALPYNKRHWAAMFRPDRDQTAMNEWMDALIALGLKRLETFAADRLPLPRTVSRTRLHAERAHIRSANVPAAARAAAVATLEGASANDKSGDVRFLASTCRYPGFPFDRHRANLAVQRVYAELDQLRPAFLLLVGDQIYADATAGLVDPLSPVERFVERHRTAFSRSPRNKRMTLGDLFARVPVVMTPDDHEYTNNYPQEAPLVMASPYHVNAVQTVARRAAQDAWKYFQSAWNGVAWRGYTDFSAGAVRVLVLDTRSHRNVDRKSILSPEQRTHIEEWLAHQDAQHRLNLIATGSVVMPGLWPDADPANPGALDNFQWSEDDRRWLLTRLAEAYTKHKKTFRFALLSGDYHVSTVCQLTLDGNIAGLAIVVPPMYAPMPYANAVPYSINTSESLEVPTSKGPRTWKVESPTAGEPVPVWCGSAIAEIHVGRNAGRVPGYVVTVSASLVDYESGAAPKTQTAIVQL